MCPICNHSMEDHFDTGRCSTCILRPGGCWPEPRRVADGWATINVLYQPHGQGGGVHSYPIRFVGETSVRYAAVLIADKLGFDPIETLYVLLESKELKQLDPEDTIRQHENETLLLASLLEVQKGFE